MQVAVHHAVHEEHPVDRPEDVADHLLAAGHRHAVGPEPADVRDELHGEHRRSAQSLDGRGDAQFGVVGEVAPQREQGIVFGGEVELAQDGAAELSDHLLGGQVPHARQQPTGPRAEQGEAQIGLQHRADAVPLYLDGDLGAVGEPCAVHTGDTAAGHRLPVELGEGIRESGLGEGACHRRASRLPHLVGEFTQRVAPVFGDQVTARAEQLPRLDEERPQRGQQPGSAERQPGPTAAGHRVRQGGDQMSGDDQGGGTGTLRQQPPAGPLFSHGNPRSLVSGGPKTARPLGKQPPGR